MTVQLCCGFLAWEEWCSLIQAACVLEEIPRPAGESAGLRDDARPNEVARGFLTAPAPGICQKTQALRMIRQENRELGGNWGRHGIRKIDDLSRNRAGRGGGGGDGSGADGSSLGTAAGRFHLSREEYDGVFSAGDFGAGERGAIGGALFGEPMEKVRGVGGRISS